MHLPSSPAVRLATFVFALLAVLPAHAGAGPCRDDGHGSFVCGSGPGAARVIEGTVSPSKRLALAWRAADTPPTEMPDDEIEDLVIRLADGAVLAKQPGAYWQTVEGAHANRREERGAWSPDSRWLVETAVGRFEDDLLRVYAFDKDANLAGSLDLLTPLQKRMAAELARRGIDRPDSYSLSSGEDDHPLTVDRDGVIRTHVMMWQPKDGPQLYYAVTIRLGRGRNGLSVSIDRVRFLRRETN